MSAMGRKQPSALASYQIPRANAITSSRQIVFPICDPTSLVTGRRSAQRGGNQQAQLVGGPVDQPVRRHAYHFTHHGLDQSPARISSACRGSAARAALKIALSSSSLLQAGTGYFSFWTATRRSTRSA